jgi:hypothetical protein
MRGKAGSISNNCLKNGLLKPPRRDTRALNPAGMFGGKAPLRLAAQEREQIARAISAYAQLRMLTFFVNGGV